MVASRTSTEAQAWSSGGSALAWCPVAELLPLAPTADGELSRLQPAGAVAERTLAGSVLRGCRHRQQPLQPPPQQSQDRRRRRALGRDGDDVEPPKKRPCAFEPAEHRKAALLSLATA